MPFKKYKGKMMRMKRATFTAEQIEAFNNLFTEEEHDGAELHNTRETSECRADRERLEEGGEAR